MKSLVVAIVFALASISLPGQSAAKHLVAAPVTVLKPIAAAPAFEARPIAAAPETEPRPFAAAPAHHRLGIASDWSQHHVLFPASKNLAVAARIQNNPRWTQSWYLHHHETWWPGSPRTHPKVAQPVHRDWNVSLGTTTFEPLFDFAFNISPETGNGTLNTYDPGGGSFVADGGVLNVTGGGATGTYPVIPGATDGSQQMFGGFTYTDVLFPDYPSFSPPMDGFGLLFGSASFQIDIQNQEAGYAFYGYNGSTYDPVVSPESGTFTLNTDPGGGQTSPAKYVFDVTAPLTLASCTSDYVAIGIPAAPAPAGQANIVGYNNLYTGSSPSGVCTGTGPNVMFAYASGSGEVPASISLSLDGTQLAYVEDLFPTLANPNGSSYFHALTIGTKGSNGTGVTAAAVPGSGNDAVDAAVLLSPDGSITQSSTTAPFIEYTSNAAYATTYSWASGGSGYLYKINNVFGVGTPTIAWSVAIDAVPSEPVYDSTSNNVFFTDSMGRIDYVTDAGGSPSVTYGPTVASGTTSLNPVTVDTVNQMVYGTFNYNGSHAVLVQAPIGNLSSYVTVPVGVGNITYTGPYGVDFNNYFYTGAAGGTGETQPEVFVIGTDSSTGTIPTVYGFGFTSGVVNTSPIEAGALATGVADASAPTEFYNATTGVDYLFVGVTDNCGLASGAGGLIAFDLNNDTFPAIDAAGGTSGIIVDNDSPDAQASSLYYATKTGATLVKVTQNGLQ